LGEESGGDKIEKRRARKVTQEGEQFNSNKYRSFERGGK